MDIIHQLTPENQSAFRTTTPEQYNAQVAAEQARADHAARREWHMRRLYGPRPLEDWARERIYAYWSDIYKETHNVRKTA